MHRFTRRKMLKLIGAGSVLLLSNQDDKKPDPKYVTHDAEIQFHCTANYPQRWKQVYESTLEAFSNKWGKVGPTHVFLIENDDWQSTKNSAERKTELEKSQAELKRLTSNLLGQDSDGSHFDWVTGNHWSSWSIRPENLLITMTMTPDRDGEQFVIGPMHEYVHAIQIAFGYAAEAIDGNRMGHALWTGPAWWREGSAVITAALFAFQHPELFKKLENPYSWRKFSGEMNRNLEFYQKAKTPLREGVTHNDWQRLEPKELVYPVIYAGGSIACSLLLKKSGSLENFMMFYRLVPKLGWEKAFEEHFKLTLSAFYKEFESLVATAEIQTNTDSPKKNMFHFLSEIKPTEGNAQLGGK